MNTLKEFLHLIIIIIIIYFYFFTSMLLFKCKMKKVLPYFS